MNDLNRASLDEEIERQHEELAKLNPTSQEYKELIDSCKVLMDCANQDDKIHNEAAIAELKLENASQAVKSKERWQLFTNVVTISAAVLQSFTTILCYLKLIKANERIQQRSIDMEKGGIEHTSRDDKFVIRPQYPRL